MTESEGPPSSPVETNTWPKKLDAHVVSPGPPLRVHGYALCEDLARHYDFGEFLVTALVGTPPTPAWGEAVNMALVVLSGIGVERTATHVATLARRCGADDRSTLQTGFLGLVEEVSAEVSATAPVEPAPTSAALEFHRSLPDAVRSDLPSPESTLRRHALLVLSQAGLSTPMQQMVALSVARLPTLAAETMAVSGGDVRGYPMQLPKFEYQHAEQDEHD